MSTNYHSLDGAVEVEVCCVPPSLVTKSLQFTVRVERHLEGKPILSFKRPDGWIDCSEEEKRKEELVTHLMRELAGWLANCPDASNSPG